MKYKILGKTNIEISAVGQGGMGIGGRFTPDTTHDDEHIIALRLGIENGMTFLDTAEIYGGGHSEELIGRAVEGIRDKVFIATKFSPEHSSYDDVISSCGESLDRLGVDCIDLYQIHWPNPEVSIKETMRALEYLVDEGKIGHIGVSNFSVSQLEEARASLKKHDIVSNQVEYNFFDRSIEEDILPYCEKEDISIIAYSPLDQGKELHSRASGVLGDLENKYNLTSSQIALNWLWSHPSVVSIPKALTKSHIIENATALDVVIDKDDLEMIDEVFSRKSMFVPIESIKVSVEGEGARKVYQTKDEAIANKLGFCPSPMVLGEYIRAHPDENIKPVRLVKSVDESSEGNYYDLVEGRVRYWAWVLAFDGTRPIPACLRVE